MTGKPADFVLSVNEISYTNAPLILHVNMHETVEGRKTELREGHNPKRYKMQKYIFSGKSWVRDQENNENMA